MINKVYLMDCMDFMRDKPDKYYDLAIVDPPYGINFAKTYTGKGWIVRESKDWDKSPPDKKYFQELFRISKNQIIWGGNYFVEYLVSSQGWIVWDKGQRNFSLADGELAYTSFDRALRVFDYSRGKMASKEKNKKHPTQKPVALYKWLLQNYAKPGQTIFDSHVGSGSIRIACHDMGFYFEGTEIDQDYWQAQENRYNTHAAQGELFSKSEYQRSIFE